MTMDEILERITGRYVEEGECWIWTGGNVQGTRPYVTINYKRVPVRKLMAIAKGIFREGRVNPPKCGNPLCVNPDHVASITKSQHMRKLGKLGGRDLKRLATIRAGVHPNKKLSDDQVLEIRNSTERSSVLARRYGVSACLISRVRLHKTRKHLNPFAGLIQ